MLPDDTKARRQEALERALEQTQVDDHFHVVKPEDKPEPYSDDVFKEAALQWLIETDQVCLMFLIAVPSSRFFGTSQLPLSSLHHFNG